MQHGIRVQTSVSVMPPPALLDAFEALHMGPPSSVAASGPDLTQVWTPRAWQRCSSEDQQQLEPWRPTLVIAMFERLRAHVQKILRPATANEVELRTCWERGWMMAEGFLPRPLRSDVVTNERFGFVRHQQWHEWQLTSAKVMRYHWAGLLQGLPARCHHHVRTVCSELLATLPGPHEVCVRCRWTMPGSEMHNATVCSYCNERERYPYAQLTWLHGVPLIKVNETRAVKDECQLVRTLQSINFPV